MVQRSRRAFTLAELIVTLVLAGIVTAIAVPVYNTVIDNSIVDVANREAQNLYNNAVGIARTKNVALTDEVLDLSGDEVNQRGGNYDPATNSLTVSRGGHGATATINLDGTIDITTQ